MWGLGFSGIDPENDPAGVRDPLSRPGTFASEVCVATVLCPGMCLDPPSTLKYGLGSFYLGILRVYRGYLGGLGCG